MRYVAELEDALKKAGVGRIATVVGRYYAMDRDKRWERTKLAYDAVMNGTPAGTEPVPTATSAGAAIQAAYDSGVTDEFIKPVVIVDADGTPVGPMRDGDSLIVFNFRADRARQISRAVVLGDDQFDGFARPARPKLHATTMTVYDRTFDFPVVFTPQTFSNNLADVLAAHGRTNLRLAETEKYAHVTYFFNCGREEPYEGEDRILVPSQKVATYDLMPQMSAPGIADNLVDGSRRAASIKS